LVDRKAERLVLLLADEWDGSMAVHLDVLLAVQMVVTMVVKMVERMAEERVRCLAVQ
jgi:hypothetical protein